MPCLQGDRLQPLVAETFPTDAEKSGIGKNSVQRARERIVFIEVLPPKRRALVARKNKVVCPLLVVAAIHHIKEQARALLVKLAMPSLVDDQAGGTDKGCERACLLAQPSGIGELVPKLGRFDEISAVLADHSKKGSSEYITRMVLHIDEAQSIWKASLGFVV